MPNEASCFGLEGHVPLLLKLPRCSDFTWLSPPNLPDQRDIMCYDLYSICNTYSIDLQ